MQHLEQIERLTETSSMTKYMVKTAFTVRQVLEKLDLEQKYFAVLVNGRKAGLDEQIKEGSEIIILPKIAGG
jgi:molybdopterin converting factor small subunit